MEKTMFIVTALAVLAAMYDVTTARRHPFPGHCSCRYNRLPSSCSNFHPDNYPAHHDVFSTTNDCLPSVPANHRVCYLTDVKYCTDANDSPYYGCYLRVGGRRVGYKLARLPVTGGDNESRQVFFDSVHSMTATKAVCFYNVSVTDPSTSRNCSGVVIESASSLSAADAGSALNASEAADDSTEEPTVDRAAPCRSYVRIYYSTDYGGQQERVVCVRDLPGLYTSVPGATSLFIVYWTNNDVNNRGTSFSMRVRCID